MIKKWKKMAPADRIRAQVACVALMLAFYSPLYFYSSGKLFEVDRMLSRRKDRIEKRTSMDQLDGGGVSVRTMENRIAKVETQIEAEWELLNTLDSGFVPMDSVEKQQELMLELSRLAARSGVQLLSVGRRGHSALQPYIDSSSGRPLLDIKAIAQYGQLIYFLNGLPELSFHVAVLNVKIDSSDPKAGRRGEAEPLSGGRLYIQLELSI